MRIPRIFTEQSLSEHSKIALEEAPSHHILKVLRMAVGRELIIFNGLGGEYKAHISAATKKQATLTLGEFTDTNHSSSLHTHLAIGMSRGERFDLVLQKATELGVSCITPLITERTEIKLNAERLEKKTNSWKRIIISACEQCGLNKIPTLNPPQALSEFLEQPREGICLVLHHRNHQALHTLPDTNKVTLLIGPEGGLSEQEITVAEQKNFHSLRLGPRILRTETAPIVALSLLQYRWGDL